MEFNLNANVFPGKLWRLVNNSDVDAVTWNPEGDGIIVKEKLIEKEFLCLNGFKSSNFFSFVRQLNSYGFRKPRPFKRGGVHQYFNPNFQRNHPELLLLLRRCPQKSRRNVKADLKRDEAKRWTEHRNLSPDQVPAQPSRQEEDLRTSAPNTTPEVEVELSPPASNPLHDLEPGDWIMVWDLSSRPRKRCRWEGPHQVLQACTTAVMIAEGAAWLHASRVRRISQLGQL